MGEAATLVGQAIKVSGESFASVREKRKLLLLFLSIVALMCSSLEVELVEQIDSMMLYMTFREILWDTCVALLILLGMASIWMLSLLMASSLVRLIPSLSRKSVFLLWRIGLMVPMLYFALDFFDASRLRFFSHWHPGPLGWLWQGPTLLAVCISLVWVSDFSRLLHFCRTRLAPIGWLHLLLAGVAIVALWQHGIHFFRDYVRPAKTVSGATAPDIYLITVDALRAEDMSLYGYDRQTTPNLERFAQRASILDFFFANSNFTTAATASMETGQLPWTHRVFQLGGYLRGQREHESLAAILREHGYYTASISANNLASPIQHRTQDSYDAVQYIVPGNVSSTFSRCINLVGFNTLYTLSGALLKSFGGVRLYLDAFLSGDRFVSSPESVLNRVRKVLNETETGQPRFVWAHILPPHDPYLAPLPYRGRFLATSKLTHVYNFLGLHNDTLPPGVSAEELRARYDEDIAYSDQAIGDFLDWLDQTGRLDRSIVIITADHGESFEHGWYKHTGPLLYNGLIRIPLLVHLPGQRKGSRISAAGEQIDLLPTILDLVGAQTPSWSEGISLVPALQGRALPERPLFSMNLETNNSFGPVTRGTVAAIDGDIKYIERLGTQDISLYRYRQDPFEKQNLALSEPAITAHMKELVTRKIEEANNLFSAGQNR